MYHGGGVEKRRILTLLSLTFIKDVVCIRRPPLLSFYDKLRHAAIWWHPGNHRARHYLANPIPFDLCRWWTLFTIGRPPTSTPAPVKETGAKDGWGKRMTERRRVKVRMRGPKGGTFTFHSYVCEQLKPVVAFDQNYCVSPPHGHHPGCSSLKHEEKSH